jgi:hypothetical protein
MPKIIHERANLLLFSELAGAYFGTEEIAIFLYSLIRMQRPKTVLELGTGLGASAFWMALGVKQNGIGHVWSIDDFDLFEREPKLLSNVNKDLKNAQLGKFQFTTPEEYFQEVSTFFSLNAHLTVLRHRLNFEERNQFDLMPFSSNPIDLLFSDFRHSPVDILAILAEFIPRMSDVASIFIDSASTYLPSYLVLEQLVTQLNAGRIPTILQELSTVDLSEVTKHKRFVLVHITREKSHEQNATAWLKIEPDDQRPHPCVPMRIEPGIEPPGKMH